MKVYVNPNGTHEVHINSQESAPTGVVEGHIEIMQGDTCVNDDTQAVKVFNGTSWVDWS